jgi:hypothetical protein
MIVVTTLVASPLLKLALQRKRNRHKTADTGIIALSCAKL